MAELPRKIQKYIQEHVESVEQLEVLQLLSSEPSKEWSVQDVDQVIRSSTTSLQYRLNLLCSQTFLACTGETEKRYRFAPHTESSAQLAEDILQAYKSYRTDVIKLIFSKPKSEMLSFSEAFKLGGKKNDS